MTLPVIGGLLGAVAAAGVLLAVLAAPPMRRITLAQRVAPYLGEGATASRLLGPARGPAGTLARLTAPILRRTVRRLNRLVGGEASVRRRLGALNSPLTVEDFRLQQVLWGGLGLLIGLGFGGLMVLGGKDAVLPIVLLALGGMVLGVLARDFWLSREVAARDAEMLAEFPVIAEMLALAVTAGEGPVGAIDRITRLAHGRLVDTR